MLVLESKPYLFHLIAKWSQLVSSIQAFNYMVQPLTTRLPHFSTQQKLTWTLKTRKTSTSTKKNLRNYKEETNTFRDWMNHFSTFASNSQPTKSNRRMWWFQEFQKERLRISNIQPSSKLVLLDLQWVFRILHGVILLITWQLNAKTCQPLFTFGTWQPSSLQVSWSIFVQSNVSSLTQLRMISTS